MKKPILIGITGGIGSGKTLVCKIFSTLGTPVYYADDRAKYLMNFDQDLKEQIIKIFGTQSYNEEGSLNRIFLGEHVFNNPEQLEKLNNLVHPAVRKDFISWIEENSNAPYLIKEAALIFESGADKNLDFVINVVAPEHVRIKRVLNRDKFRKEEQVRQIISRQLSDQERSDCADIDINNDGQHLLIPQVLVIHRKFY